MVSAMPRAPKSPAARAFCNNEVAYMSWRLPAAIPGCLGFMITRVITSGTSKGSRRVLPAWIAFRGQANPEWEPQDTSIWPVQKFNWRDLTLRRLRDGSGVRDPGFTCFYEITPVGLQAPPGEAPRPPVPAADPPITAAYRGTPLPLFICGPALKTNRISVTFDFGAVTAAFNNGILSTQNMRKLLDLKPGVAPTRGDVQKLLSKPGPAREFLAGDILPLFHSVFERAAAEDLQLFAALYELDDAELIGLIETHADRMNLILTTAGSKQVTLTPAEAAAAPPGRGGKPPKTRTVWDTTNAGVRPRLHAALGPRMQDRMFNTDRIGHNKFVVLATRSDPPKAVAVLTGSTNWTSSGLAGQSNNAVLIDDATVAAAYLAYWQRLREDVQPVPVPISAPNDAVQGPTLRGADMTPADATLDGGATAARVWFSPNTMRTSKADAPPPDLTEVYAAIKSARKAILLLCFNPGQPSVIGMVAASAIARPELLVQGAVSDDSALPGEKPPPAEKVTLPDGRVVAIPAPAIAQAGVYGLTAKQLLMVRASALRVRTGDLLPEVLTTGFAIIHDKIIVIDPMSEADCVVITGSHNLGHRASYANDENMVILRGNQPLAAAYAAHVLDVYEHYRFRAVQEERYIEALRKTGKEPEADQGGGFLHRTGDWQDAWFRPDAAPRYFLDG